MNQVHPQRACHSELVANINISNLGQESALLHSLPLIGPCPILPGLGSPFPCKRESLCPGSNGPRGNWVSSLLQHSATKPHGLCSSTPSLSGISLAFWWNVRTSVIKAKLYNCATHSVQKLPLLGSPVCCPTLRPFAKRSALLEGPALAHGSVPLWGTGQIKASMHEMELFINYTS